MGSPSRSGEIDLNMMFEIHVRVGQLERRSIANWWQLEQDGEPSPDVRHRAAEEVREAEAKRIESEATMRQAIRQYHQSNHNSSGQLQEIISRLEGQLQDNEHQRIQMSEHMDRMSNELITIKNSIPPSPLPNGYQRLSEERDRQRQQRTQQHSDDMLESRIGRLESELNEAAQLIGKLRKRLETKDATISKLKNDRESISAGLTERMNQLEGESEYLQNIAKQKRGSSLRSTSNSPSYTRRSRSQSPTASHKLGQVLRSSSPALNRGRPSVPTTTGGISQGGHGGPKLGLEVADALYVGRIGSELKYDGVRVVTARRPSAPQIREGDIITKVNDCSITSLASFKKSVFSLDPQNSILITLRRKGTGGTTFVKTADIKPRQQHPASHIGRPIGTNNVLLRESGVRNARSRSRSRSTTPVRTRSPAASQSRIITRI